MDILDTRPNLTSMVLCHDQQIKDLAAHLLELKQLVTLMMEFKKREWVGLTEWEREAIAVECGAMSADWLIFVEAVEKALKEKNL